MCILEPGLWLGLRILGLGLGLRGGIRGGITEEEHIDIVLTGWYMQMICI